MANNEKGIWHRKKGGERKTREHNKGGLLSMRHVVRAKNAELKIMKN